jgi:hypothetical protein
MQSHIQEELAEISLQQAAAKQIGAKHAPPAANPEKPRPTGQPLGDFAAIVALSIAFCTLLLMSLRTVPPPAVAQTFELPPRPIWISTVPYGPRDGLVPDFGQQADLGGAQPTPR